MGPAGVSHRGAGPIRNTGGNPLEATVRYFDVYRNRYRYPYFYIDGDLAAGQLPWGATSLSYRIDLPYICRDNSTSADQS